MTFSGTPKKPAAGHQSGMEPADYTPKPPVLDTGMLDLFSNEIPREPYIEAPAQQGSPTSKAAARNIQGATQRMRENIYNAIIAAGAERGITRLELEAVTGYKTQTLCARLNELEFETMDVEKWTTPNPNPADPPIVQRRNGCAIYRNRRKGANAA